MNKPMPLTASTALQQIQSGELSCEAWLNTCLQQIQAHNPRVNAIVSMDVAAALQQAQALDRVLQQQPELAKQWLLCGLPMTIKDCFATRDHPTTSSFPALAHYQPQQDASIVARVRAAGAIIIGKTNLPALAADVQCHSPLFGTTHNPWQLSHTPGGSSGGSAAAIACGMSYLELGSDLAGSIRIPAAYCGVIGLKATEHSIPCTGHIPPLPGQMRSVWHMLSAGLLGRSAADLALAYRVIAGPDGHDSRVRPLVKTAIPSPFARPLRIAWWDDFAGLPLCSRTQAALQQTVQRLQQAGMTLQRVFPADFIEPSWHAFGHIAGTEIGLNLPWLARQAMQLSAYLLPSNAVLSRALARGMRLNMADYHQALNQREHLIRQWESFLDAWDVCLCPVATTTAYPAQTPSRFHPPPRIRVDGQWLPYFPATISMVAPFSVTGSPVVSLPVGIFDGLPVGLQLVGRRWQDQSLLHHAAQIEAVLGSCLMPAAQ